MAEPVDPNVARAERAANRGAHNAPADPAANEDATDSESEHDAEEEAQGDDEAAQPHADRRVVFSAPRNIVQLPKFSGKPAESKNVNFFLEKLDAFFEFHGYTLPRHILPTLYSCFPDDSIALRWYSNARSNGEITSYRTFKRACGSLWLVVDARTDALPRYLSLRGPGPGRSCHIELCETWAFTARFSDCCAALGGRSVSSGTEIWGLSLSTRSV